MTKKKIFLYFTTIVLFFQVPIFAQDKDDSSNDFFQSKFLGSTYNLYISLPQGYEKSTKIYPVLYLLDPNWYFGMTKEIVKYLTTVGDLPEMIIVGPGYIGSSKRNRNMDYTPPTDPPVKGLGGARGFLRFLKSELIPHIDSNYRTNIEERILVGHSYGGLMALFSLFESPDTFNRILAASPSLWYGDKMMFDREIQFYKDKNKLKHKLFISMGSREPEDIQIGNYKEFIRVLDRRNYEGLSIVRNIFAGMEHQTVVPSAITEGLVRLFEISRDHLKPVKVSKKILKSYVGDFKLTSGAIIKVTVENEDLFIKYGGGRNLKYIPFEENKFYHDTAPFIFEFEIDNSRKVKSLVLKNKHKVDFGERVGN